MRTEQYKARNGNMQFRPILSQRELDRLMFDSDGEGFCLACGNTQSGVEPDARRYTCENCSAPKVYGFEELALMGLIKF